MTGFCDRAWQRTARLRAEIDALPFNRELAAGTLGPARFQFYIQQDALYLEQYSRVLLLAAARSSDAPTLRLFAESALGAVAVEQALHGEYLAKFGAGVTEPSPDCLGYTSFLLAAAYNEPWEVLLAALLPCFWIYWDVGNAIAKEAVAGNPYQAWIDTYSDVAFGDAVRAVVTATDAAAANATETVRARMMAAFIRSSQYEYLFWDGAYQLRGWPVGDLSYSSL